MSDSQDLLIDEIIASYAPKLARGEPVDPEILVAGLLPNQPENRRMRDWAVKVAKIKAADYDHAYRNHVIRLTLDKVPNDAAEYVAIHVKKNYITAHYNGTLTKDQPVPLCREEEGDFVYDFTVRFDGYKGQIELQELLLTLRVQAAQLKLPFSRYEIDDAVNLWLADQRKSALKLVYMGIDCCRNPITVAEHELEFETFMAEVFEGSPKLNAAVFRKFFWQVKRKMMGLPITGHLMPVLLGKQGIGKSTLLRQMLAPVADVTVPADFKQITDDRNIALWRNYVVQLDEMGWASKADIDTVKNIISAPTLTRRLMHTNSTDEIEQRATFIGASNVSDLGEIIRDTTGNRRFYAITMKDNPNREAMNSFDWEAAWQAIPSVNPDPMIGYEVALAEVQEEHRNQSNVEEWLGQFRGDERKYLATRLYESFKDYEEEFCAGAARTTMKAWGREMRRLRRDGRSQFQPVREAAGVTYIRDNVSDLDTARKQRQRNA